MPYEMTGAVVMGTTGSLNEEGTKLVGAAWFIVNGMRPCETTLDRLTPNEMAGAVEIGAAGWLNEEGMKLVGGCWVVGDWMEGVRCVIRAASLIVVGIRA